MSHYFNEALLFCSYEVYRHADFTLLVDKTEICEICNSVEKLPSKVSIAKIKRLRKTQSTNFINVT